MFEPICVGFCFPFLAQRPWQIKGAPFFFEMGQHVQSLFKENPVDPGNILRQLLCFTQRLPCLSGGSAAEGALL